jgi:hypothetical protein
MLRNNRIKQALIALGFAPANYMPATPTVDGHLAGIDTTLGGVIANASSMGTFAATPGAPVEGAIHVCTDVPYIRRWNGAAWTQVLAGVGIEAILPVLADYAWLNQGASVVTDVRGSLDMTIPQVGGLNLRVLVKTAPATPWTVEAWIAGTGLGINFVTHGMCFRQTSDGRLVSLAQRLNQLNMIKYNSPTSGNLTYATFGTNTMIVGFRLADDGVDRISLTSADGVNWIELHSVARLDWLTAGADQVGFYADGESPTIAPALRLLSWREF